MEIFTAPAFPYANLLIHHSPVNYQLAKWPGPVSYDLSQVLAKANR